MYTCICKAGVIEDKRVRPEIDAAIPVLSSTVFIIRVSGCGRTSSQIVLHLQKIITKSREDLRLSCQESRVKLAM